MYDVVNDNLLHTYVIYLYLNLVKNYVKVLKILETMDALVSRSGKMLSTFEFWLELNTRCKRKTLLALVNKLFVYSSI